MLKKLLFIILFCTNALLLTSQTIIYFHPSAGNKAVLASKELRRYIYQRTGSIPSIITDVKLLKDYSNLIIVGNKNQPLPKGISIPADMPAIINELKPEEYCLRSFLNKKEPCLYICGGDSIGMLYGAYRFAEIIGVRFYLHGDVIPDVKLGFSIPEINEVNKPLFAIRGILPFHDFPEGPDWWETENYLAIIDQLPKMRMNFFGLHTYTSGSDYIRYEPTVWLGTPADYHMDGRVKKSYPSKYANTGLYSWGYKPRKTSDFSWGADQLFEKEHYTSEVMDGLTPLPDSPEKMNQLFDRTAAMLKISFTKAQSLGVKTCVGTEVPTTIHYSVSDELKKSGKIIDSSYAANLYKGIFGRIEKAYPIDYYWLWTGEGWTWEIPEPTQQQAVVSDFRTAINVHKEMKPSFKLATCGWVLGPPQNRSLFDDLLPKEMPISCINRYLGYSPVDISFASVKGRDKWAIPWLEDDPRMISPQLWVGRVRRDAVDAYAYGCNGLMGIHWRTDIISPNISALAQAQWSHNGWHNKPGELYTPTPRTIMNIEGTEDDAMYATVAYNPRAIEFTPKEAVEITLYFCELQYDKEQARLFDILINGKVVKEDVDIYRLAGGIKRPYEVSFREVSGEKIIVSFKRKGNTAYPILSGIAVAGKTFKKKINVCGEAYRDFEKDLENQWNPRHPYYSSAVEREQLDYMKEVMGNKATGDFYSDWSKAMFGPEISAEVSKIFVSLDGNMPHASEWKTGPGNIRLIANPWMEEQKKYNFVASFERLGKIARGAGNIDRYEYWLNHFKYARSMAELGCKLYEYENIMTMIKNESDNYKKKSLLLEKAIPMRIDANRIWGEMQQYLISSINTTGELGTIANLEGLNMEAGAITKYDSLIKAITWQDLPASAYPTKEYKGKVRIIVPAQRSALQAGEDFYLKIIVIGNFDKEGVFFWWKKMGSQGSYDKKPLKNISRGVYEIKLPASIIANEDFEYYINAGTKTANIVFPATAPTLNQTVIVTK